MTETDTNGTWVARYADGSSVCVFGSEIDALRHAVVNTMHVAFVPYGEDATSYDPDRPVRAAQVCHYGRRGAIACGAEYNGLLAAPDLHAVTCPACLRLAPSDQVHALRKHPDFEYTTTTGPRKAWAHEHEPPVGPDELTPDTSWERNVDAGNRGWERFDHHEESYWRRRRQP